MSPLSRSVCISQETEGRGGGDLGKPHTLQKFAVDHFRPPPKRTLSRTLARGGLRKKNSELWAFGRVCFTLSSLFFPSSFPSLSLSLSLSLSRVNHVTMYPLGQDPIKQPLLKKLLSHNDELQQKAVTAFLDILAYSCISLYTLVYSSKLAVLSLTAVHQC